MSNTTPPLRLVWQHECNAEREAMLAMLRVFAALPADAPPPGVLPSSWRTALDTTDYILRGGHTPSAAYVFGPGQERLMRAAPALLAALEALVECHSRGLPITELHWRTAIGALAQAKGEPQ